MFTFKICPGFHDRSPGLLCLLNLELSFFEEKKFHFMGLFRNELELLRNIILNVAQTFARKIDISYKISCNTFAKLPKISVLIRQIAQNNSTSVEFSVKGDNRLLTVCVVQVAQISLLAIVQNDLTFSKKML